MAVAEQLNCTKKDCLVFFGIVVHTLLLLFLVAVIMPILPLVPKYVSQRLFKPLRHVVFRVGVFFLEN